MFMRSFNRAVGHAAVVALFSAALLSVAPLTRSAESDREDELKAAYLFNFTKLVEWPATTRADTLTVCFVGASSVSEAFARTVGGKQVGARQLVVKAAPAGGNAAAGCNVIYFEGSLATRVAALESSSMALTVSDAHDFAVSGGIIELFAEGNRLRFNINLQRAQHAGLRISSSLLQLAVRVEKDDLS
jgi:hypothetical protein